MEVIDKDIVVVGLGAFGSAALWRLAERGADVAGVERYGIGHPYGSSHGMTRLFRIACMEHTGLPPIALKSLELWTELGKQAGEPLVRQTGCLSVGAPDSRPVAGTLARAAPPPGPQSPPPDAYLRKPRAASHHRDTSSALTQHRSIATGAADPAQRAQQPVLQQSTGRGARYRITPYRRIFRAPVGRSSHAVNGTVCIAAGCSRGALACAPLSAARYARTRWHVAAPHAAGRDRAHRWHSPCCQLDRECLRLQRAGARHARRSGLVNSAPSCLMAQKALRAYS